MKKTRTIKLNGKTDYAKVSQRIQEFREANKNGLIETIPTIQGNIIIFKARVVKDKGDDASAEASGHSYGENKGDKAFEKLETIAVGRALALLGYGSDGEIASSEEMDEFLQYQKDKLTKQVNEAGARLKKCKTIDDLKTIWADLPIDVKAELEGVKEAMKTKLTVTESVTTQTA